jgi:enterochelin esterase-like enzyme
VEKQYNVKLGKDPNARATMGGSSGGSVAMAMASFHPELYHRVLTYSGTYVNNQFPADPALPHGAWELHEHRQGQGAISYCRTTVSNREEGRCRTLGQENGLTWAVTQTGHRGVTSKPANDILLNQKS